MVSGFRVYKVLGFGGLGFREISGFMVLGFRLLGFRVLGRFLSSSACRKLQELAFSWGGACVIFPAGFL